MDKGNCVIKLKLEPDIESVNILDGQSRICNWLYNHLLERAQEFRSQFIQTSESEIAKILYTKRGLRNLIPEIKQENPFLNVVHSSPLKIVKQLGVFYAVFTVYTKLPASKAIHRVIALDPNHKNLAYGVDTEGKAVEITAPTWLKICDKRIDALKQKRDRCQKKSRKFPVLDANNNPTGKEYYRPSKRWKKYDDALKRCLQKRQDQTKIFLYTTANQLIKQYDCVAIGNYTPHGEGTTTQMRRAMNNQSLIGRFKEVLSWVAQQSGKTFIEYDEKGTTRTCSHCNIAVAEGISPSIREWRCGHCQALHHRDENAAKNGLKKVLRDLKLKSETLFSQVSGSDLVQIVERWAWRVLPSGVLKHRGGKTATISQRQEIKSRA